MQKVVSCCPVYCRLCLHSCKLLFIPLFFSIVPIHLPSLHSTHALENCKSSIQPSENSRSVLADKLTPIIFKSSGGGGGSRSSLFGIMLSALNIVYSICAGAGRRLLWSVLFFKQSISDIALFSWDRVIFSHWPGNITQPLMESWRLHPPNPLHDLNKRIQLNKTWKTVAFNWKGIILYMKSETISREVVVLFNNSPIRHLSLKWKLPPKEMPHIRA